MLERNREENILTWNNREEDFKVIQKKSINIEMFWPHRISHKNSSDICLSIYKSFCKLKIQIFLPFICAFFFLLLSLWELLLFVWSKSLYFSIYCYSVILFLFLFLEEKVELISVESHCHMLFGIHITWYVKYTFFLYMLTLYLHIISQHHCSTGVCWVSY